MKKKNHQPKTIPLFSTEDAEARFWEKTESTDYFPNKGNIHLRMPRRTVSISLRLPVRSLQRLKRLAQLKDVPYQSLLKIYLDQKIGEEVTTLKKAG